jgi:hypothetical protein
MPLHLQTATTGSVACSTLAGAFASILDKGGIGAVGICGEGCDKGEAHAPAGIAAAGLNPDAGEWPRRARLWPYVAGGAPAAGKLCLRPGRILP